jgi:hypothetical protein
VKKISKSVELKISDPSPPPKEIRYFPKNKLKTGSIQYFPEGLLGHQFLKRGFQGTYAEEVEVKVKAENEDKARAGGKEVHLFLAIFKNPEKAMSALKVYKNDLSKRGKAFSGGFIQFGTSALKGEDTYQGKVIVLQKGFYLLGAVGFEKEEFAESLLAEFVRNVKG